MKRKRGVSPRKSAVEKKRNVKRLRSNAKKKETSGGGSERRIVKRESDFATWSENKGTRSERSEKGMIGILIETETETEIGIGIEKETGIESGTGIEAAIATENETENVMAIVAAKARTCVRKVRFYPRN